MVICKELAMPCYAYFRGSSDGSGANSFQILIGNLDFCADPQAGTHSCLLGRRYTCGFPEVRCREPSSDAAVRAAPEEFEAFTF